MTLAARVAELCDRAEAENSKVVAIQAVREALAECDEVIADYSKVVGEMQQRLEDADEKLASVTAQRDSARDAHDAGKRYIAATEAVVNAAKAYSQVSDALEHFKGSTEELGALADAHSLARYAVRAAVDALAGQTSTGVAASGAGSNGSGRSVASDDGSVSSVDTGALTAGAHVFYYPLTREVGPRRAGTILEAPYHPHNDPTRGLVVRVEKERGGTDIIALTHVDPYSTDDGFGGDSCHHGDGRGTRCIRLRGHEGNHRDGIETTARQWPNEDDRKAASGAGQAGGEVVG